MKRLLVVSLVCVAVMVVSRHSAWAGYPHHPLAPAVTYIEKEVETCEYVCETTWHVVTARIRKPKCVTVMEKREVKIAHPVREVHTKRVAFTVMVPVLKKVPVEVCETKYFETTGYKTICVDHGHWAVVCGGCGGPCGCRKVWMPKVIEKQVPYTCLVPKLVSRIVEKEFIDYVPKAEEREIAYPVCRLEFKFVTEEVPVTTTVWEEEEVTVKVPHVSVKKIPVKRIVRVPVICGVPCLSGQYAPSLLPAVQPKGNEAVPPPIPGKAPPKKDAPKKDEPKTDEPKADEPQKA